MANENQEFFDQLHAFKETNKRRVDELLNNKIHSILIYDSDEVEWNNGFAVYLIDQYNTCNYDNHFVAHLNQSKT